MRFPHDWVEMLAAFADEGVRYLTIGGYAVSLHAHPRTTLSCPVQYEQSGSQTRATAHQWYYENGGVISSRIHPRVVAGT